jgi:hypothetical protein
MLFCASLAPCEKARPGGGEELHLSQRGVGGRLGAGQQLSSDAENQEADPETEQRREEKRNQHLHHAEELALLHQFGDQPQIT